MVKDDSGSETVPSLTDIRDTAFQAFDEPWSTEHDRPRASCEEVRETFLAAGFAAAKVDWTCIGCERTFSADVPRFVDENGRSPVHDICIDCSH